MKKKLVIVGNGMATGRFLDDLMSRDCGQYEVTVIGDEAHGSYNRIMLSPVLANEASLDEVLSKPVAWYESNQIHFFCDRAISIDAGAKEVQTRSGENIRYDELVIATGSRPARIPAKNQHLQRIFSFRTLDDVDTIRDSASSCQHALVIGGGLLGLEAAYALAKKSIKVTVVHRGNWLMNRQLDAQSGAMLQQVMEDKNIELELGNEVTEFLGENQMCGAQLKDGKQIKADMAVIATGITPNKELAETAGLPSGRGIQVDALMQTSDPHISAIGECIEFEGQTYGLVDPIWRHCQTLADRLCLAKETFFVDQAIPTKLKVSGVQLFSAGEHLTGDAHRELVCSDPIRNIYRKILLKNGCIVGVVLFGDTKDGLSYYELMESKTRVESFAHHLLFGRAYFQEYLEAKTEAA